MKKNKKIIFLCGAYGYGNPGDEAMLFIMVKYLKIQYPHYELWANSFNPADTRKKSGINIVHTDLNKDIFKKIWLFLNIDIVIYNGGTQIAQIPFTLKRMILMNLLMKIRRKKVIYFGVGVGYINSKILGSLVLRNVDLIILRDLESHELLDRIYQPKKLTIKIASDPIFKIDDYCDSVIGEFLPKDKLMLGISLRIPNKYDNKIYTIAKALNRIIMKYDIRVVFIPWQKATLCRKDFMTAYFLFDDEACFKVYNLMNHKDNVTYLEKDYSPTALFNIISQMDFVLGMPYHFLCMGAMNLKPLIGIDYCPDDDMKIFSLFKDLGQLKYLFKSFDNVNNGNIYRIFGDLFKYRESAKLIMKEKVDFLKRESRRSFEYLREVVR